MFLRVRGAIWWVPTKYITCILHPPPMYSPMVTRALESKQTMAMLAGANTSSERLCESLKTHSWISEGLAFKITDSRAPRHPPRSPKVSGPQLASPQRVVPPLDFLVSGAPFGHSEESSTYPNCPPTAQNHPSSCPLSAGKEQPGSRETWWGLVRGRGGRWRGTEDKGLSGSGKTKA